MAVAGTQRGIARRPAAEPSSRAPSPAGAADGERAITEDIYIDNVGLVLAAPYLLRLFDMLGLTQWSGFTDVYAERAVHLLQYSANESTDESEYQLVLNKIPCGVPLARPIASSIDISDREREVIDGLIQGMIQNWAAIGNTSPAGFRESFLQR